MKFVCYEGWAQLPDSANVLFQRAEKDSVFFSRPWFENLSENSLEDGQSVVFACVVEGQHVNAILPLRKGEDETWYGLGNLYTSLYSMLIETSGQEEILRCLAVGLKQLPFNYLRMVPLAKDDKVMLSLQHAMASSGFECSRYFRQFNWLHRLHGETFTEYMAGRPGMLRSTIKRKKRKLEREHGCAIRLYKDGDLAQALADYRAIYDASWKVKEPFDQMIGGLANVLAEQGWLRMAILYAGEQPIAGQFWFVVHGKASIFRLAYDEGWKAYSPGSILTAFLMQHVIDSDKVSEIDFLTGNDRYKQDWMSERRERVGMICMNKREEKHRLWLFLNGLARRFWH